MKRFVIISAFLFTTLIAVYGQKIDLGSWNVLNLKYNYSEKWSYFGEAQLRSLSFYNNFHYHELKGGLNYKINKQVKFTLSAGSYQTYKEGGNFSLPKNNDEFRLWPQITLFQSINKLKIDQRYRSELRFTSSGYNNRFRYRLGISYPFGKEINNYKPYQLGVSNEIFFTDKEPYFERNRMQLSLNCKPSKSSTIQFGYIHQFDYKINDEIGRDFIQIGFYYELNRKENSNSFIENEIKDN